MTTTEQRALVGRTIVVKATLRQKAHTPDFPGWGDPNYAAYLVPIQAGWLGTITNVENHGMNPWTRYSIRFDNGCRAYGVDPADVTLV